MSRPAGVALLLAAILLATACGADARATPCADGECVPITSGDITLAAELDLPPGPGPHPVIVMVHGSGRGTRDDFAGAVGGYLSAGVGVVRYDKRGAGQSTGGFRDVTAENSIEVFDELAADLVAVVSHVRTRPDVDPGHIGLVGVSQAGWVMTIAASRSADISFMVSISGAASSVGLSDHYDRLAEDADSATEIADALDGFDGTHGYDPAADLEALAIPVLWIYGARDLSNPTAHDLEVIELIGARPGKDFTIHVFANADHDLIDITTGQPVDAQTIVNGWLTSHAT